MHMRICLGVFCNLCLLPEAQMINTKTADNVQLLCRALDSQGNLPLHQRTAGPAGPQPQGLRAWKPWHQTSGGGGGSQRCALRTCGDPGRPRPIVPEGDCHTLA